MHGRSIQICVGAAALLIAVPAYAQRAGEAILHSEVNYRGHSHRLTGERQNLVVPWPVRSISIARNEAWDLCIRPRFQGCTRFDRSTASVRMIVLSARPIDRPVPGNNVSLRGMSAEFFPQPSDTRGRVISCAAGTAACAASSATAFCRSRGWTGQSYNRQETIARQNFLADVLCTRTGN